MFTHSDAIRVTAKQGFQMNPGERERLSRDGFVVRERVFSIGECGAIARDCETLMDSLAAGKSGTVQRTGTFIFEQRPDLETTVKWEREAEGLIRVEPFAHLSEGLNDWGLDARLTDPCKAICGADNVVLFTEKLNLKRARRGGHIQLHQDFPYWEPFAPVANRVATAMIFLDDTSIANGCLEVAPGSHRDGKRQQRVGATGFDTLEMDPATFDVASMIPLEVPAGSVAFFGAYLVHRSGPNTSDGDRRALLYSYQPAGFPHARELLRAYREKQTQQ